MFAQRATDKRRPQNPEKYRAKIEMDTTESPGVRKLLADRPSAKPATIVDLIESGQVPTAAPGSRFASVTATAGSSSNTAIPQRRIIGRRVDEITPRKVSWLWHRRIPRSALSGLAGDPGIGKSTITLDLIARASSGRGMPFTRGKSKPINCLLISAEDGAEETIRPRLGLAEADLARVSIVEHVESPDGDRQWFSLVDDLEALEHRVREEQIGLVVIDPLMAYLGNANSYRDQDVRSVLGPLSQMAQRTGSAILLVRHLNKSTAASPTHRPGGSIGITAAMRSELLVSVDPNDATSRTRVLAPSKSNLASPASSLLYRIEGESDGPARVEWIGKSSSSAADLLREPEDKEKRSARKDAEAFLRAELSGGPRWAKEIIDLAYQAGHSQRTITRAKAQLGIEATRVSSSGEARWNWSLPDPESRQDGQMS